MASSSSSSSSSYSPCAACKFLRRKCLPDSCIFAPYFPPEEPTKFVNVHRVFGASNVSKLLTEIPPHQRQDAVSSLAYEAEARLKDPVYGCVGAISALQRQLITLQNQLDATNAHLLNIISPINNNYQHIIDEFGRRPDHFDPYSTNWGWNNNNNNDGGSSGERSDDQAGGDVS